MTAIIVPVAGHLILSLSMWNCFSCTYNTVLFSLDTNACSVDIPKFSWEIISTVWFSSERLPLWTLNITQNNLGVKKFSLMFRPVFLSYILLFQFSLFSKPFRILYFRSLSNTLSPLLPLHLLCIVPRVSIFNFLYFLDFPELASYIALPQSLFNL